MSCHYDLQLHCKEAECPHHTPASTSTPFVSAPSSPRHSHSSPALHLDGLSDIHPPPQISLPASLDDFDFSVRIFGPAPADQLLNSTNVPYPASTMSTAEELFLDGKIKPLGTSFFSTCSICFKHAVIHEGAGSYCHHPLRPALANDLHTYDPACRPVFVSSRHVSMPPQNDEEHIDGARPDLQASGKQGQAKLSITDQSGLELWRKGPQAAGRYADKLGAPRHVHAHRHVGRAAQISRLPLASYNKASGAVGHHRHRRARSLSPLRVFHMDDMIFQPRPSFESELLYTHMSSRRAAAAEDPVQDVGSAAIKPRRRKSRKSWTLKELLNLGVDNRVHDKKPHRAGKSGGHAELKPAKFGKKGNIQPDRMEKSSGNVEKKVIADKGALAAEGSLQCSTTSSKKNQLNCITEGGAVVASSPWKLQQREDVLKHAEDYHMIREAHAAEETKKRTLPYKRGLLACLGFSSKLSSVKGLHAMPNFNAG